MVGHLDRGRTGVYSVDLGFSCVSWVRWHCIGWWYRLVVSAVNEDVSVVRVLMVSSVCTVVKVFDVV